MSYTKNLVGLVSALKNGTKKLKGASSSVVAATGLSGKSTIKSKSDGNYYDSVRQMVKDARPLQEKTDAMNEQNLFDKNGSVTDDFKQLSNKKTAVSDYLWREKRKSAKNK